MKKKKYLNTLCILNIFRSAVLIGQAYFSKILVDTAKNGSENLTKYIIFYVSIVALIIVLSLVYNILRNRLSIEIEVGYKKELYNKIIEKEFNEIKKFHSGELSNMYLSDVNNIKNAYVQTIPNIFLYISRLLFALVALIFVAWKLLIVLLIVGIFGFLGARLYSKKLKKYQKDALDSDGVLNSYMSETVRNIKIVKALNATSSLSSNLEEIADKNYEIKHKRNMFSLIGNTGINSMLSLSYALALVYAVIGLKNNTFTYGDLVLVIQLVSYFEGPFAALGGALNQLTRLKASEERINEVLILKDDEKALEIKDFTEIKIENMSFSYDKDIYKNFNLTIKKGDIVNLRGTSGSGKTTLFNLLLGFLNPTSGSINIKTKSECFKASGSTRGLFSYVSQENNMLSGTVLDNILLFSPKSTEKEIKESLEAAVIYDELMAKPLGLKTRMVEGNIGLSGGQIQRVMIAVALLLDKEVMLLDEFNSNLDYETEYKLVNNLSKLHKTLIIISHRNISFKNMINVRIGENNDSMSNS